MSKKNPEEMSDAELREALLNGDWDAEPEQPEEQPAEQPRDEQGRFKKPDEQPPAEEEKVVYQRIIDLGDGSGVQVFEAESMEELIDKLAEAQKNATKKIREQAAQIKTLPKETPAPPQDDFENLSEAEKFLLQQEMLQDPAKAIRKFVNRAIDANEKVQRAAAAAVAAQQEDASAAWVKANPDFYACPKNGERMTKYLQTYGMEVNAENLTTAFEDLNASGLLEARPKETPATNTEEPVVEARIEQKPTQTVVRRKVVGGLSTKRQAPAPPAAPGLTEDELYKMPMAELEQLMLRTVRQ